MATLHIFNPEHDIALAAHLSIFTAPRAGRQLRHDLCWLPALWAAGGDLVFCPEKPRHLPSYLPLSSVTYVTARELATRPSLRACITAISPWGWDRAIAGELQRCGLGALIPADESLSDIRKLSHRAFAATHLLPALRSLDSRLVGEAMLCQSYPPVSATPMVLKSPWSSTGRGVRYVTDEASWQRNRTWAEAVIQQQGGLMREPLYDRVMDFAMEFYATAGHEVQYLGLSLFHTQHGAYVGNLIASEQHKRAALQPYVDLALLDRVRETILQFSREYIAPRYEGPFGVDMMVVRANQGSSASATEYRLHPCVELNLRRTMGHVALCMTPSEVSHQQLLSIITSNDVYSLELNFL